MKREYMSKFDYHMIKQFYKDTQSRYLQYKEERDHYGAIFVPAFGNFDHIPIKFGVGIQPKNVLNRWNLSVYD